MNKDAQGRWKVGMSNIKLKMRVENPRPQGAIYTNAERSLSRSG